MSIKFKTSHVVSIKEQEIINNYRNRISDIFSSVQNKTAPGCEMTGWIPWIFKDHSAVVDQAEKIKRLWKKEGVKTVVVIGIGGSFVGAKACLNFATNEFDTGSFQFIFVPTFSERFIGSLLEKLEHEKFAIVVISKSGTTLEPSIGFRLFRELLFKKESEKYSDYIVCVTDKEKGVLRPLSDANKFASFVIEDDIGGRFSTLTPVGLVVMVLAAIDVYQVLEGAKQAYEDNHHLDIEKNSAALYASYRHHFFSKDKLTMECIISYDPHLNFTLEKMKQLFAESEGKKQKGLMPVLLSFTADLHSVGQLLQDGPKSFFETTILVSQPKYNLEIKSSSFLDDDKLDWLVGKSLKEINNAAFEGTVSAHTQEAAINNIVIELPDWSPKSFGYFYFWVCMVAMYSSYLFNVNPFDQPGVEAYKKRMFDILKK